MDHISSDTAFPPGRQIPALLGGYLPVRTPRLGESR
jgi:hypothetical protein